MGAAIGVHCSTVGVALRDLAKHGAIKIMSIGQAKIITLPDGRATPWPEGIDGMELQNLEQAKVRKKRSRYDVSAVKVEKVRQFVAEHPAAAVKEIAAKLECGETTVKQALAVLRAAGAMTGERRAA
jgi:DNA-binding transcriptional regulator YhcF (GntR family)